MSKNKYEISLPAFEGPLDLLLHLIERDELDVTALSLATVTDQYLQQVERLKENKVPQLIDFIVVGARLMVIKSRALLPTPPVTLAGEEELEDPADALLRQLKLYKVFKQSAEFLKQRHAAGLRTYLRLAPPPKMKAKLDLKGVSAENLQHAMIRVNKRWQQRIASVDVVAPRRITIEGQIDKLRHRAKTKIPFHFTDLISNQHDRTEIAVSLLALLELIKRREVQATQNEMFGPITIQKHTKPPIAS